MRDSILRARNACILSVLVTVWPLSAAAAPVKILILHTNDLHDHVRTDYDGRGGLAFVSGYIRETRQGRDDVLVVDAGDVMEKGDLAVFHDQSRIMYRSLNRAGYDAIAPGNHDDAYGDPHLGSCARLAPDVEVLAVNLLDGEGEPIFSPSAVFDRAGLRIGVIGVFKPRDENSLSLEETAQRVDAEARRLEPEVDLIVAVAHLGPGDCEVLSQAAPNVDVFVSGHTHEALHVPRRAKSGAIIVQAGSYAEYVGRLELTVDSETEEILAFDARLVEMLHDSVEPDPVVQGWFEELEERFAPSSDEVLLELDQKVGYRGMAYLGAEGLRRANQADIGFCHMSQIIRAELPRGAVDANAIFRTGGQRGYEVVRAQLPGHVVAAYVEGLANSDWGKTHWSGFAGTYRRVDGGVRVETDLKASETYDVVMPRKEWDTRFLRFFHRADGLSMETREAIDALDPVRVQGTFTDGVVALLRALPPGQSAGGLAAAIESQALGSKRP